MLFFFKLVEPISRRKYIFRGFENVQEQKLSIASLCILHHISVSASYFHSHPTGLRSHPKTYSLAYGMSAGIPETDKFIQTTLS